MKLIIEDTLQQYHTLFQNPIEKRADYFRYEMMKPFEQMWHYLNVPLKSKQPGGYDVLMATQMLGYLNVNDTERGLLGLSLLEQLDVLTTAGHTLSHCLDIMTQHSLIISAEQLRIGIYLADPDKLALQDGTCGFGGIPGFIQISLYPNAYNGARLPALIAHEFHHNIRFSYFDWDHGNVSVGDYVVIEGLADSFAQHLYGDQVMGPWITSIQGDELAYCTEIIHDAFTIKGFAEVSSYMFGDEIAAKQGFEPVGLPPFAGYAVGYQIVQSFLKNNNCNIMEATLLSTNEIIENCGLFIG